MAYGPETRAEVCRSCAGLSGNELTAKIHEWAHTLSVHPSTIYRWLGSEKLKRARRADKGRRRVEVPEDMLTKMMALTVRYDMTAEDVIEHAEANGWIEPGAMSVATYNRILRQRHISRSKLNTPGRIDRKLLKTRMKVVPHRRWEAEHSNQLHQMDLTELPRYFVEADGSIGFESPLTFGRNKKGNARPRLQLFGLVDDHSRASFARLYYGKNALNWIDFCMRAWDAKEDAPTFPFCGRPSGLYSDNDSAPKSAMFKQFLKDMDVGFGSHVVGNSAAKGKVERFLGVVKPKLISLLRVYIDRGERLVLEEANDILHDLLYKLNYRVHSDTREKPMLRWQAGLVGPARMMPSPEVRERYFYDTAHPLVRPDLTIKFGGMTWQLPRREPFIAVTGETVPIFFHRGQQDLAQIIVIVDNREYPVEARIVTPDAAGEFKSLPKGKTEQLLEKVYDEDLADFQAGKGIYKERYQRLMFPAQQEAFDEATISGPKQLLSKVELKLRLKQDGIAYSGDDIDALYEAGDVLESDYDTIVTRLRAAG